MFAVDTLPKVASFRLIFANTVKLSQSAVQDRVVREQHFPHRAVVANKVFEKRNRLAIHRLLQLIREFRKAICVDATILVKAIRESS